jgi:amidase
LLSDDAQIYHGAPVGLQVVARRYEEEKVLAIASLIDDALKTYAGR